MKTFNKMLLAKLAKDTAHMALKQNCNSTTCITFYQPKVPANLQCYKDKK